MKRSISLTVLLAALIAVIGLTFGIPTVLAEEPEFVVEDHVLVAYNGPGGDVVIPGTWESLPSVAVPLAGGNVNIMKISYL